MSVTIEERDAGICIVLKLTSDDLIVATSLGFNAVVAVALATLPTTELLPLAITMPFPSLPFATIALIR